MQLKKVLQGTVFAAAAAVCLITAPVIAKAADGAFADSGVSAVSIDTTKQQLTATGSNGELLVGVGKVNAKTKAVTVATWDIYDGTGAQTIDLSKLNNTKDNYLVLTANAKDSVSVVKIPAVDKATSAVFDASTAELKVGTGASASAAKTAAKAVDSDAYEYRTTYGTWANLYANSKVVDFTQYQHEGATLYIRPRGTSGTAAAPSATLSTQSDEALKYGEQSVKVYEAAKLPGKEAKLNIAARAKGPAVAVDYTKSTVTLPKASEYRVAAATGLKFDKDNANQAVKNADKKVITVEALLESVNASTEKTATVEVRAQATAGKKAASKWTRVAIEKPADFEAGLLTAGNTKDTAPTPPAGETKEYGGKGVAEAVLKEATADTASVLKVEYAKAGKNNVLKITNNGKLAYEVVLVAKDATSVPADAKATKIASTKTVTLKGIADDQQVYIRKAGDKKTKTWVGNYQKLGVIDVPKTVSTPAATL